MGAEAQQIMDKLNHIQSDLDFIKTHITDIDLVLTNDDKEALEAAEREFQEGKTTSHQKLKSELGL